MKITYRIRHTWDRCIYLLFIIISPLTYSFCDARLPILLKHNWFCRFSFSLGGFGHFLIRWSSDPHLKHLQGVCFVRLLSDSPAARDFYFTFLIILKQFAEWLAPPKKVNFSGQYMLSHCFYHNQSCYQDLDTQYIRMK